jgi:hypothetical protein
MSKKRQPVIHQGGHLNRLTRLSDISYHGVVTQRASAHNDEKKRPTSERWLAFPFWMLEQHS